MKSLAVAGVGLAAGLGLASLWWSRPSPPHPTANGTPTPNAPVREVATLSAATLSLLERLQAPLEIRFYSVLDAATVPADLQAFSRRVEELLAAYERAARGRITVARRAAPTDARAAAADGLKPFNLERGPVCYLGLAIGPDARKESLPRLQPEWEPALESDISRAISRAIAPTPAAREGTSATPATPATPAAPDPAVLAEVKRLLPNFQDVTLDDGARMLRDQAMKDLQAALSALPEQLKAAEQRLAAATAANSESGRAAALLELQQLQAKSAEKLRELTTRSTAQIDALRQLKESAR